MVVLLASQQGRLQEVVNNHELHEDSSSVCFILTLSS